MDQLGQHVRQEAPALDCLHLEWRLISTRLKLYRQMNDSGLQKPSLHILSVAICCSVCCFVDNEDPIDAFVNAYILSGVESWTLEDQMET